MKYELSRKRRQSDKVVCDDGLAEYYEEIMDSWVPDDIGPVEPPGEG